MSLTKRIGLAAITALVVSLAACSSGTGSQEGSGQAPAEVSGAATADASGAATADAEAAVAGEPLVIGAAVAQSGFLAPFDMPALATLESSIEQVNAAGGIAGRPVELQVIDTKSDRELAATAAQDLIGAGAELIITTCDFEFGAPAALVAEENDVVAFAPCSSDAKFGPRGIGPLSFSMGTPNITEGAVMAKFAFENQGWKTAYVLTDTSVTYTKGMCPAFAQRFTELGGTVVGEDKFQNSDQSVAAQVTRITALQQQPDVVVVCSYPSGGVTAVVELRRKGVTSPILSGFGMDGAYWLGAAPGLSDMYVATLASIYGDDPNADVNALAKAYEQSQGTPPPTGAFVTGAGVLEIFKKAVEEAGTTSGAKVAEVMQTFRGVPTIAGPTSFDAEYHISIDRPMQMIQITDGKPSFLITVTPDNVVGLDRG